MNYDIYYFIKNYFKVIHYTDTIGKTQISGEDLHTTNHEPKRSEKEYSLEKIILNKHGQKIPKIW